VFGAPLTEGEQTVCGATPLDVLGLSVRASNVAVAFGMVTALDVARANRDEVTDLKNCGRTTIRELRSAISALLRESGPTESVDICRPSDVEAQVAAILSTLDPRSQMVLQRRFGLWAGEKTTLEGVASTLGLTRERIRQIETKALKRLRGSRSRKVGLAMLAHLRDSYLDPNRSPVLAGVLTAEDVDDLCELRLSPDASGSTSRGLALRFLLGAFDETLERFKQGLAMDREGRWFASEAAAKRWDRLESEVRTALASRGRPALIDDLVARLRLSSAGVEITAPELRRLPQVSRQVVMSLGQLALPNWNRFGRGRAAGRVERALAELGQPTHFSYIVEKMNFLFPDKAPFQGHAITATMLRYPDVFVSLGRGEYALRNWGVSRPPYVKDFVIDTMREAGGEATVEYVADIGAKKHGFKHSSIAMTMSLHPTFFQHLRGKLYKLL
jgi:hypothetical protein